MTTDPNARRLPAEWFLFGGAVALMAAKPREPENTLHCGDCGHWHRNPEGMGNRHYGKCDRITRWTHEGSSCWKEEEEGAP